MIDNRKLIFISHANPEDNEFTLWLASRLTAAGFLVWSDVTKLFGAELFWDDIEDAIRNHAAKVIVALSRTAQQKAGVLDEIAVAVSVERTKNIERFIVPIRIDNLPFDEVKPNLTRKNIIDFYNCWPEGFQKLLKVLERDHVPFSEGIAQRETGYWMEHLLAGRENVVQVPETIFSNWFSFTSLPTTLNFFKIPGSLDQLRRWSESFAYPAYPYRDMIATFAGLEDVDNCLPSWQKAMLAYKIPTSAILNGEPHNLDSLEWQEASCMLSYLFRTAWDRAMQSKGLQFFEMANSKKAWYPSVGYAPDDKTFYADMDGVLRWRKLVGKSDKRQVHWHFGMEAWPSIRQEPYLVLKPHVVFSEDGNTPICSDKRMHRLRRGFCKSWWNARWRDLMLAYMSWVSGGSSCIEMLVGSEQIIGLSYRPVIFESPVSLTGADTVCDLKEEAEIELDDFIEDSDWAFDDDIEGEELDDEVMDLVEGREQ
jgi:hypothetical protein